ncbi:hypothetical protein N7456_000022 [Penicillium angulare]|uniref:Uncharacterized protein n=1 Tax=Penicillium angulare TaxID=116970 RepID=A0A9W9GBC4_9EURO|nr:hypothetical protein N7456_000022 [Penicillium angulare]
MNKLYPSPQSAAQIELILQSLRLQSWNYPHDQKDRETDTETHMWLCSVRVRVGAHPEDHCSRIPAQQMQQMRRVEPLPPLYLERPEDLISILGEMSHEPSSSP